MKSTPNIAVVGCGYWGPNLIRNFNSLPICNVKIACDLDEDRLAHMKSLYPGIEITTEFEKVIDSSEIDVIAIATPVRFHFEMARKSLLAGKHTFIEKPMASSAAECNELIEIGAGVDDLTTVRRDARIRYGFPVEIVRQFQRPPDVPRRERDEEHGHDLAALRKGVGQRDVDVGGRPGTLLVDALLDKQTGLQLRFWPASLLMPRLALSAKIFCRPVVTRICCARCRVLFGTTPIRS